MCGRVIDISMTSDGFILFIKQLPEAQSVHLLTANTMNPAVQPPTEKITNQRSMQLPLISTPS
jgi:hypothetical protein